jgi:hypothetical protein
VPASHVLWDASPQRTRGACIAMAPSRSPARQFTHRRAS